MLPGENQREILHLEAGRELAVALIDQIQWVDVLDVPPDLSPATMCNLPDVDLSVPYGDGTFRREASAYVHRPASRDALKQIVDRMANRIRGQALSLRLLSQFDLEIACELVTSAVKAWLKVMGRDCAWVVRRRLVLKFESVESPWVQDPQRLDLANATLHA